jgi:Lrp/AsnC family transcriptional regulator, leucine-responsive regulatory protein
MPKEQLDQTDLNILNILQQKGRIKRVELAEKVGLSIPSVSERLSKLEIHGVIRGYHALLDPLKIGLDITAFIFILSESSTHYSEIVNLAMAREEIMECHAVTGEGSHLLKIRVKGMHELERLLADIQAWPGVENTQTAVVLSSPKETAQVSLKHLQPEKHQNRP